MKERAESWKEDSKYQTNTSAEEIFTLERRSKRQKIDVALSAQSKPCIVCNNLKRKEKEITKEYEFVKKEEQNYFYRQQSSSKM